MLIGFDFSAAFAFADAGAYFPQWSESPADIRALWSLVERLARGEPHYEAGAFLAHPAARRHFRHGRGADIGGAHVCTPVHNAHLVCRLRHEKKKNTIYTSVT